MATYAWDGLQSCKPFIGNTGLVRNIDLMPSLTSQVNQMATMVYSIKYLSQVLAAKDPSILIGDGLSDPRTIHSSQKLWMDFGPVWLLRLRIGGQTWEFYGAHYQTLLFDCGRHYNFRPYCSSNVSATQIVTIILQWKKWDRYSCFLKQTGLLGVSL